MAFHSLLRSGYLLIVALSFGALVLFAAIVGMYEEITLEGIAHAASGVFALYALVLLTFYLYKGLGRDRARPSVTLAPQATKEWELEPEEAEMSARLLVMTRRPLPPPTGVLTGPSSDPKAIRLLSREEAETMTALPPSPPKTPEMSPGGPRSR